jgi:hypothetical protein
MKAATKQITALLNTTKEIIADEVKKLSMAQRPQEQGRSLPAPLGGTETLIAS